MLTTVRNNKGFIREFDERLVNDMTVLRDLRAKMAALLEEMSRLQGYPSTKLNDPTEHNPSERRAELLGQRGTLSSRQAAQR